jgi:hypothetical protein
MPVIPAQSQATVLSDANGLATFRFRRTGFWGMWRWWGTASVGTASLQFVAQQLGREERTAVLLV